MTARKTYMDQIIRQLSVAQNEIEYQCKLGVYDDVHYWEEIARGLLNRCYGFHLRNLNDEKKNYPGIDLGDHEHGIGIQVTAEKGSAKINDTIQTIIGRKVYEEFPHLMFFILGKKQKKYTVTQNGTISVDFQEEQDILDFQDILEKCQTLELEELKAVSEFLTEELLGQETFGVGNVQKEEAYRSYLKSRTANIPVIGMAKELPIKMAWIQLRLMDEEALQELKGKGADGMPYREEIRQTEQKFDIESIWTYAENMVVLAGPGAGKSTLLKKLVQTSVHQEKKVIWLSLMDVARLFGQGKTFGQAMRETMTASLPFDVSKVEFEYKLQYLFLDGLDECGSIQRSISSEIAGWAAAHPWVKVVVTSRPLGYDAAALADFKHMAILPMEFEECKNYVRELLEQLVPEEAGLCENWFEEHTQNRNIMELVSKSPLLLGFLLQLSMKRIDFGNSRIELYSRVMQEWLQGSSRQNERKISEAELMCGIEAVAYYMMEAMDCIHEGAWEKEQILCAVTPWFQKELGCQKLVARQKAEYCLDFWENRGILEKNFLERGVQYRFLHLNIGEYLTGKFVSELEPEEGDAWVLSRSRRAKWHEAIRMAVACDGSGHLAAALRKHEEAAELPTGELFLAAEGLADGQTEAGVTDIYQDLLRYIDSDNEELAERGLSAVQGIRTLIHEWDKGYLLALMKSPRQWTADTAYGVYLCMPRREMDQSILRQQLLEYKTRAEYSFGKRSYYNMEETVKCLERNPEDKEVIECVKYYYGDHCSILGMEILGEYLCDVGEQEWKCEYDKRFTSAFDDEVLQRSFQRMKEVADVLLDVMTEIYGADSSEKTEGETSGQRDAMLNEKNESPMLFLECSKMLQGLTYMQATIPETYVFGFDLRQPYCKEVVKAVGIAAGVKPERIKQELFYLSQERQENPEFRIYHYTKDVIVDCDWKKAAKGVGEETLLKGIAANSEITAIPCMEMLVQRDIKEETVKALQQMLYGENKDLIERIGLMAPYIWKENSASVILKRLLYGKLDVCAGLYRYFPTAYGNFEFSDWWNAMRMGIESDSSDLVQNACACVEEGLQQGFLDEEQKKEMLSFCKEQFEKWLGKKIKCSNCNAGAYLTEGGYCPECRVGGDLPYQAFMRLLIGNGYMDYQELIRYGQHPSTEISKEARVGIRKFWERNPQSIGEALCQMEQDMCPDYLFELLLTLPQNVLAQYKSQVVRIAGMEHQVYQLVFLEKINGLEWIFGEEKREYLKKAMHSGNEKVRARAMKVWLGQEA